MGTKACVRYVCIRKSEYNDFEQREMHPSFCNVLISQPEKPNNNLFYDYVSHIVKMVSGRERE